MTEEQINLASKDNYFCNSRLISGHIMEYDIRAANISMCREYNLMDDDAYQYWLSVDKQYREEFVGFQIRSEKDESGSKSAMEGSITYKTIHDGIIRAKMQLFEANNIQPNEVIRISNDAVYVNRMIPLETTKFGNFIEFKLKMIADTVLKLSSTLVVFTWHDINGLNIDVKGISDPYKKSLHQDFMFSFIGSVLLLYERAGVTDAIYLIEDFYNDYINRKLDIRYYRELSPQSMYKLAGGNYLLEDINDVSKLDISYNANIIQELWKILITKYNG